MLNFSSGSAGPTVEAPSLAGYVHAITGDRAKAEGKIAEMLELRKQRYVPSYNLALVHAGFGETETALQLLEQTFEERDATCLSCWITSGMDSDRMRILRSSCRRGNHYTHLRHPEHVSFRRSDDRTLRHQYWSGLASKFHARARSTFRLVFQL